jgi:hypothetical protein
MTETVLPLEIEVRLESSATEQVRLRQVKVKEFRSAQSVALGDEHRLIEICCDKPQGWAETLSPESFGTLAIEARRINTAFFSYCERVLADQIRQVPPALLDRAIQDAVSPLGSRAGLPKSRLRPES